MDMPFVLNHSISVGYSTIHVITMTVTYGQYRRGSVFIETITPMHGCQQQHLLGAATHMHVPTNVGPVQGQWVIH